MEVRVERGFGGDDIVCVGLDTRKAVVRVTVKGEVNAGASILFVSGDESRYELPTGARLGGGRYVENDFMF